MYILRSRKIIFILIAMSAAVSFSCNRESKVWVPAWKETSPLLIARAGATTVVYNGYIYVMGGVVGSNFFQSTEYSKILSDGSLGKWQSGPSMIEPRGFAGAAVKNGYIYVAGGSNGKYGQYLLRSVERSKIMSDGRLSAWEKEKNEMNMPRRCAKLVINGNTIFSIGGYGGDMLDTVEHAIIKDSGELGEWFEEGERLSELRYIGGAKVVGGVTYLVGGHHQTEGRGIADVEWSKIIDDAGYQKWNRTTSMHTRRYGLSLISHKGSLYALGGLAGVEYLNSIEKAEITDAGGVGGWRFTTPLMVPKAMMSTVVYKNRIYVIGGTNLDNYLGSVEYSSFNDKGEIGIWVLEKEVEIIRQKMKAKAEQKKSPLPHNGIVKEMLSARNYTYLLVKQKEKAIWIAAPKINIKVGERIAFSKGIYMVNFYSKGLKRNFPSILFVANVRKME